MKINDVKFITSAPTIRQTPPSGQLPEIVVVGRSNVGKSSFLCSLTGRKGLAKVSSVPGKTRLINYFLVDERWYLVDLPGYGYAKVSKREQERWGQALEEYLRLREGIVLAVLLVDSRHEAKDTDLQMYEWLSQRNLPVQLVLTKQDKCTRGQMAKQRVDLAKAFGVAPETLLTYSSVTGQGRDEFLKLLDTVL